MAKLDVECGGDTQSSAALQVATLTNGSVSSSQSILERTGVANLISEVRHTNSKLAVGPFRSERVPSSASQPKATCLQHEPTG